MRRYLASGARSRLALDCSSTVTQSAVLVRQFDVEASKTSFTATVGRRVGIAGLSALIGGVLVLGFGGRLAMRLSGAMALASDPATRFMLTGDGFQVGRITLDGTIGLIIFGGVFGSIAAAAYWALLKDRLPAKRQLLWAGLAAAAIGGNFLVHPDNIDFVILEPVVANVVLYPALTGIAGVVIVLIDRRLSRSLPRSVESNTILSVFAAVGMVLVALLMVGAGSEDLFLAAELVALAATAAPIWIAESRATQVDPRFVRAAALVAVGVVVVEWGRLVSSAFSILA